MSRIQKDKRRGKQETWYTWDIFGKRRERKPNLVDGRLVRMRLKDPLVPNHQCLKGHQGSWTLSCKQRRPWKIVKFKNKINGLTRINLSAVNRKKWNAMILKCWSNDSIIQAWEAWTKAVGLRQETTKNEYHIMD